MTGRRLRLSAVIASLVIACGSPAAHVVPSVPEEARQVEQGQLLLYPVADGDSLLGRPVQLTGSGSWTIAEGRAPACEVAAKHEKAAYATRRHVALQALTSLSGAFAKVISLEAQYGTQVVADIAVDNTEVVRADTRGACGDYIVDKVFLGRGKRTLSRTAKVSGSTDIPLGPGSLGGAHDSSANIVDELEWSSDQAYAFTFRRSETNPSLELSVTLPETIHEGDEVVATMKTSRPAHLVVYYLEETGPGQVLWPSQEEPEPRSAPNGSIELPSTRERAAGIKIRAALRRPGVSARETLVVYAFSEANDFRRLRPEVGGSAPDGAKYAAELTTKLDGVPLSRWARSITGYTIEPKPSARRR